MGKITEEIRGEAQRLEGIIEHHEELISRMHEGSHGLIGLFSTELDNVYENMVQAERNKLEKYKRDKLKLEEVVGILESLES